MVDQNNVKNTVVHIQTPTWFIEDYKPIKINALYNLSGISPKGPQKKYN